MEEIERSLNYLTLNNMVGKYVIVRTYSEGVHFGLLSEKAGSEVILKNARRLYYWKTNGGISLSEVANTGLHDDSKVCGFELPKRFPGRKIKFIKWMNK